MFTIEVINSETSEALESIAFETYRDLSQYVRDAIEWGIQVSNVRYKIGNVILDFHTVYLIVGKDTY
jgi:predicted DNA-binding protein